ncbi:vacuolar sorting [Suhomyces tanzawaensis NRRL Y-17324]|uniref:Vacuolar protein sorting-associated protein n=1 Tax=Suhomyces tanzawaensis NRRL Y-17324 TaxID=984487 RepID=A0A1E4SE48_9ASCO|nr:vacuolar sorting [Suhomyces tanzawaensis NRRL Y-17324]ODV77801.1 vacuolar sorting [Suhomyces tanzawaensis NRRL Y-17324]
MFESLVANVLNRFLGSYIENFDPKQLNIGIWSGDVKLKNLQLKKESLDKFNLPLDVKFGHLGELTLQIPWSNLKSKPVRVIIEDVYLLASPLILEDFDLDEEKRRNLQLKKDKLDDLEAIQSAKAQNKSLSNDLSSNETFTESLVTKIVDNTQIIIKNIHIRYEDDSTLTENPYAVGFTLNELSAVSTDESWIPSFISITQQFTRKLLTLKNLSCYMNTNSKTIYVDNHEELLKSFKESIVTDDCSNDELQFLLKPVTGNGKVTVHKSGTTDLVPHIKAELFFQEFGIELDSQQYHDLLWTASKFHWYNKTQKFRKFRPKVSVSEDPKAWFRYAAKSIVDEIHERNYKWSWGYFEKRRNERISYISLWKAKLLSPTSFQNADHKALEELEAELSFEDIKFYRSLARSDIRKNNSKALTTNSQQSSADNKSGWLSYFWDSKKVETQQASNTEGDEIDLQLSEDQRKALYEAIEYEDNQELINSIDVPRDTIKLEVQASLEKGGIYIKLKNLTNLAEIVFEGCTTQLYQRPDSFLAKFQLQEFRIEDGTQTSLYKHIVSVKQVNNSGQNGNTKSDPFFQVAYEHNPLNDSADSLLLAKLRSITVFHNPKFFEEVMKFFKPPKIHLNTIGAIMNAAEATMEGLSEQTRIGLQYALEEHKTIDVKLDLQAPLIILPLDPASIVSPVAIIDAGHISVVSDLVEKSKIEEIKSKENYSTEDWKELNTMMYDQFNVHLQDAQFLVGSDIKSTMEQLHTESHDRPALILDKLNINLLLGISILPEAFNLPKFKIGGDIPKIGLALNDFQYKTIMQIIDVAIPNLDILDTDESSLFNAYGSSGGDIPLIEDSTDDISSLHREEVPNPKNQKNSEMQKQHIFEFNLNMGVVNVSLSRCIDGVSLKAEPLVDLIGDGLDLQLYKTLDKLHLDLSLEDINLIDHIERSSANEFDKLISSNHFSKQGIERRRLFKLDYERTRRIVEFNGLNIEVFDQDMVVDIATVQFVVSRKSYLSILNFILNTFTDPNADPSPADELKHNDSEDEDKSPQRINVDIKLDSIILLLSDDGLTFATLELSTANINVFLVPEELEVTGILGALSLHDEVNEGTPKDSSLRNLISIEGNNLAEFKYKTFDAETNREHYDSLIEFKTGSLAINFVESSFNRIIDYLSQFLKMKAIYDRAREAAVNQASLIDNADKIKFDILIKAPTIIFPRLVEGFDNSFDTITSHLGELYASNEFVAGEVNDARFKNIITAGIRNISLRSQFHFVNDIKQVSEIVNNLDMSFKIEYSDEYVQDRALIAVCGNTPEIDLNLTELQLKFLMSLVDSISRAFTVSDDQENLQDVEKDAANANAVVKHNSTIQGQDSKRVPNQIQDLKIDIDPGHNKIQLVFEVPKVSLTIFNKTSGLASIDATRLASFSLNNLNLNFTLRQDGHFESNITVRSFIVKDVRHATSSKFTELIPPIQSDNDQFLLTASTEGPVENRNIVVFLTVDNPKTILALDYIFELQNFFDKGFESDRPIVQYNEEDAFDDEFGIGLKANDSTKKSNARAVMDQEEDEKLSDRKQTVSFSINIKEPSITLLENPTREDTLAAVFKVEQLLITSQQVLSLAANNIGLFLCKMNDFGSNQYRIIDDFSISFAHDSRGSSPVSFLTNIQASIDPILIRVSLRDIRFALNIFNKASELYKLAQGNNLSREGTGFDFSEDFKRRLSQYAPSILTDKSAKSNKLRDEHDQQVVVKGEEFNASVGGVRFVLIGDVHELPVLDMNIKPFEVKAINWSTDLSAEMHIEQYVNIYNYSKSSWEPLLESWPIAVYVSKSLEPKVSLVVDVVSRKLAEITVTSRSVALLSQISNLITTGLELKPRGQDNPYIIVNETGFDIEVWADNEDEDSSRAIIKSQERIPWSFEDWKKIRQNLDTNNEAGILGLKLLDSPYESIHKIAATGEGEMLFMLFPPIKGVHNRLSCEIVLGDDNVKTIWLRSTVRIQNDADVGIKIKFSNQENSNEDNNTIEIESGESKSLPIDVVYSENLRIKPLVNSSYEWSNETFHWKDFLDHGHSLNCPATSERDTSSYYFQAEASYDADEPLSRIYPHMTLIISAPVEIENLLPFDFDYRIYDKHAKKDWNGSIPKGIKSYVHVVSLTSLLLLSVEPKNCGYGKSEFAIINTPSGSEFKREHTISLRHSDGQQLKLRIHYPRNSSSKSLKISIYSPYVILNKTGKDLVINEKGNLLQVQGKALFKPLAPCMFSFENHGDRKNRAILKADDSTWSSPLSFDALGQASAPKTQIAGKQKEYNYALSIAEGEGKYILSKVVTLAPRYVIQNTLDEAIQVVENGTTNQITVEAKQHIPLYGLRRIDQKSLLIKFTNASKTWSSPFTLDDIGQVFLKVHKENIGQILLKVNIIIEDATIFIQIENANNHWPYSIRNFSDSEFFIYQSDPNINENGETVKNDTQYKPIYYRIPPKSVMPYAYDYPNAIIKELVIRSHGRERAINLAEIGNLKPFRLPPLQDSEQKIVDLNVVADGPTQSLIITNYDPSLSLYKVQGSKNNSSVNMSQTFEATENDENYHTKIITKIEGFGISLINTRQQELCYITLRGLELRYNESDLYQNLSLKLKWIQVDNQLYGGIFPIIVYPSVIPKSGKEMNNHPSFSGSVCKVKDDSHGVIFIKYATVLLQEMTIEIDEDFLFALLDFAKFPGASWNKEKINKLCDESLELPAPETLSESSDIYFEALHLQPALANLSFVRTERVNVDDKTSSQNTLMFFFNVLTMAIGNINDAPIKLNALFIENIRVPIPLLVESIQTHYGQSFFYQVHKILGSADFLGNPVGLFKHLSSGVLDIFYEPYQGFIINDRPQELGIGIAKGGLSFLKKSIFGFSDSFAKVTGSLAKGLSVVTLDKKFQERRRLNQRRNKPKHALYGMASGASSFYESISSGVTGIASAPIEGASTGGAAGFFKGLGKGVVGLPTKTAIGLFDFASNVSEGIRNTTTVFDAEGLDKVRLPRHIANNEVIKPYSQREAQGQYWLNAVDGGIYFEEKYLAHLLLSGEEKAVMVTYRMLILFETNTLTSKWVIRLDQVKSISVEPTGINIGLKKKSGPFLPIPEKSNRNFLYNKISIAVEEFNKHCQVIL